MNNFAWVTLLGNDEYMLPVIGLYQSFQKVKTAYPLIVIAVDTLSKETYDTLNNFGIDFKVFPNVAKNEYERTDFQILTLNKFYAFHLTEYDKIIYLDADIIINQNIDYLFKWQAPAAKWFTIGEPSDRNRVDCVPSELMVLTPGDFTVPEIINKYGYNVIDDHLLKCLYPVDIIAFIGAVLWEDKIYHSHAHLIENPYWIKYDLTIDTIKSFIDNFDIKRMYEEKHRLEDDLSNNNANN